jgi:hypothetical protein
LKHWTWPVVAVDVCWGTLVTAVSATIVLMLANLMAPKIWPPSSVPAGPGPAEQRRRTMRRIAGRTLRRIRDTSSNYFGCGTIRI